MPALQPLLLTIQADPPPFYLAGETAALTAAFVWSGSVILWRYWGRDIPPYTLNLFKSAIAFACLAIAVAIVRPPCPTDPAVLAQFAISGVVGLAIGDTAFFAGLRRLGAQATSCGLCLAPPLTVILAALCIGEEVTVFEGAGIGLTVAGVAGVMHFGQRSAASPLASLSRGTIAAGFSFAFLAALCQAAGLVIARNAFQHSDTLWGTLIRIGPALAVLVLVRACHRQRTPLADLFTSRRQLGALFVAAFAGTFLGVLLQSVGTKYAKAGIVSALTSTFPLWVIPTARVFLKEHTNRLCVISTFLAVGGIGLMMVPEEALSWLGSLFSAWFKTG